MRVAVLLPSLAAKTYIRLSFRFLSRFLLARNSRLRLGDSSAVHCNRYCSFQSRPSRTSVSVALARERPGRK